jgi:DNA-binding NtrC family response regulator
MARLLLIDNDEKIVSLVALLLRKSGHEVRTAISFVQAREELLQAVAKGETFDLALSDYEMGLERADEELPKLIQAGLMPATLVVSGYLDDVLVGQLLAIKGVVGTLKKPFDFTSLSNAVAQALVRAQDLKLAQAAQPDAALETDKEAPVDERLEDEGWEELS